MSNLIKWNYINLERENRRIIDSDHSKNNPFLEQPASGISSSKGENADTGSFREGVKAINYDEVLKKEREEIETEKEVILSEARRQADEMISQARSVAENIKNDAYEQGYESGKEAGQAAALEVLGKEKAKLSEYQRELEENYREKLRDIEPMMAEFMAKMIEKLTGAVVEGKKDIILYLIRCGLEQAGKSSHFVIRVSQADYPLVERCKEELSALLDGQGELSFREDKGLTKNQCVIETDTAIIESSLDIQLENLSEDIRLMALSGEL